MRIEDASINDMLYRSGDVFLPKTARDFLQRYWIGSNTSIFYVTNWSIVHFLSGIATGYLLLRTKTKQNIYLIAFIIHTVWELWQVFIGMTPIYTLRGQVDTVVDTVFFMVGVWVYLNFLK
jgi:hypothetical protein